MTEITLNSGDHTAVVVPDAKGRFALRRWLTREPVVKWRVFRFDDGKTIVLEAVPA